MPASRTVRRPTRAASRSEEPFEEPDDQTEDDKPARSSSRPSRRSAPESSRPTRRTPRPRDDEDDEDEGDDEEKGSRRVDRGAEVKGGWATFKQQKAATSNFPDEFKVEAKQTYVIAFLDEEPFASYRQHWIDERKGKKSFVCLEEDCPLCEVMADSPRVFASFNVVEFVPVIVKGKEAMEPQVKVWNVGVTVGGQLADIAEDSKKGPLTSGYWAVSKSGTKSKTVYAIDKIKERDLFEDYGVEPLTDEQFEELEEQMFDSSIVKKQSRKELREIAKAIVSDD